MGFKSFLLKLIALRVQKTDNKNLYLSVIKKNNKYYKQVIEIINRITQLHRTEGLPLKLNMERILMAAGMALYHHRGTKRKSGHAYFVHPLGLAQILIRRLNCPDEDMYIAAFLHDLREDTDVTLDEIRELFGEDVAFLVDGLTKLEKAAAERNVEKFIYYIKKDIRILLLKTVDRGHNLLTAKFLPQESRERNAKEALDLYVPLCVLAGFMKAARQLADVAYRLLMPEQYEIISRFIHKIEKDNKPLIDALQDAIRKSFNKREKAKERIRGHLPYEKIGGEEREYLKPKSIKFFTRPRTPYELAEKWAIRGISAFRFSDAIMVQVIVDDEEDCAYVYNLIHSLGEMPHKKKVRPLNRFHRDFVNDPKVNMYKSLHTAIEVGGTIVRFQIRTNSMQETAERGVISQSYRKGKYENPKLPWLDLAYLEELMKPEKTLTEKITLIKTLQTIRYTSIRVSDSSVCIAGEAPIPLKLSPIEIAFIFDPEKAMKLSKAEIDGIPHNIFDVYNERISIIDLLADGEVVIRDYLDLLMDVVARRRFVEYLRSLDINKQSAYARAALEYWLNRYYLTLNDMEQFDKKLRKFGFRGLKAALNEIGKGSISAYEIYREMILSYEKLKTKRKLVRVEFHLKDWKEDNYTSLITPLRVICGGTEKITIQKDKEGTNIVVSVSLSVRSAIVFRQVENFIKIIKEKYSELIEGVIVKNRKRIKDPFYGFEVLDIRNPYHDFVKAIAIRELAKSEDHFYILDVTGRDSNDIIGNRLTAWRIFSEDVRETRLIFIRLPRRETYKFYKLLGEELKWMGIKVVYIYSDGRYSDPDATTRFLLQLLGPKNIISVEVNKQLLESIFR